MTGVHPCVLWLNGGFGVGKTTAARALVTADPQWRVADPELLGAYLSDAERSWGEDFQAHPGWPALVAAGIHALAPAPDRPVVVPMAVHDRATWCALREQLDVRLLHVVLHSDPTVLLSRVETGEPEALPWRRERARAYESALEWLAVEGTVLRTDLLTPEDVAAALRAGWQRVRSRTA